MKVFGWIQSKLKYGRHYESNHKPNLISHETVSEPGKEEVNDWLHGLLAIGTFGKNDMIEDSERIDFLGNMSSSSEDRPCGSVSEKLQDNLSSSLCHEQDDQTSASASELEHSSQNAQCFNEPIAKSAPMQHGAGIVSGRGKDACVDNKRNGIGKKSLSFLLKKMLVCRGGFTLPPSPRASIPESRTEMIFRAILHRKIYPQSLNPSLSTRKYLENRNMAMSNSNEDEMIEKANKGSKWVKTDSEYIVLEM